MTVRLELYQAPTDNIADLSKFYPAKISVPHHQLRRFISTSQKDRIYYATDNDIFLIDLQRQQSTLLATVSFGIRCLAANHGWLCVGGENDGQCAFMTIEQDDGFPKCFGYDLNEKRLGGEIVNSMNVQIMSNHGNGEDEPVVLISNNDKTVKVYSLARNEVVATSEHDVPMNYAAMSPDCNIIAAVGDCERVFFAQRSRTDKEGEKSQGTSDYPDYTWHTFADPVVPTGEPVYDDYGFAISFSPSGHLCAASAQGGAITVFDMCTILDPDSTPESAIVCNFRSSRSTLWGCVRAMEFSPEPWDLLAWAEDHGRIVIADIRHRFVRRQTVDLNKEKTDTVKIEDETPTSYKGLGLKEKLDQQNLVRIRPMTGSLSRGSRVDQIMSESRPEASQRRQSRHVPLSYHHGLQLDARERSILEALEITMDDVDQTTVPPYSVNYSSSPRFTPSVAASDAIRQYAMQTASRSNPRAQQPRRRTSVVLSDPGRTRHLAPVDGPRGRISASPGRITDDEDVAPLSNNEAAAASSSSASVTIFQSLPSEPSYPNPWHTSQDIPEHTLRPDSHDPATEGEGSADLVPMEDVLDDERQLGSHLHSQLHNEQRLTDLLRQRLETQERLMQSQQRELNGDRENDVNSELLAERSLQGGFGSYRRLGQLRSQYLDTESQQVSYRSRQAEPRRSRLLNLNDQEGGDRSRFLGTSAQTTTLPTTNLRQVEQSEGLTLALENRESLRTGRMTHLQDLEEQLRIAESQVVSASSDVRALEEAMQQGIRVSQFPRDTNFQAQLRARALANVRNMPTDYPNATTEQDGGSRGQSINRRAELPTNANRSAESRRPEPSAGFSERELQLARMMHRSRIRPLDANGNWDATALGRGLGHPNPNAIRMMSSDEIEQEMGVGTAGVGWSPDGRYLFAGSTEGIFEIKVNLKDRMTFPTFEMR